MLMDRIILICTILITIIYLWATTQIPTLAIGDPLGPKAFPNLLGIAMLIAAGIFGLEMWKDRAKNASKEPEPIPFEKPVMVVLAGVTVLTALYYFIFNELGFIVATSLYLLPMMVYFNRGKWIANTLSAVGFSILIYVLFVKLDVNLPQGILTF